MPKPAPLAPVEPAPLPPPFSEPLFSAGTLTPRELLILGEIVNGATSREIGARLGVSRRTIEFHRANIMRKFAVRNIAGLVRTVLQK